MSSNLLLPNRPINVPEEAIYNLNNLKEKQWELALKNDKGIRIGLLKAWNNDGTLIEESNYIGDEGDVYVYKGYSGLGELWQEGRFDKGVYTFMRTYKCKGNRYIYNFDSNINEDVQSIEYINYISYINDRSYYRSWEKAIYYDKNGKIIKEYTNCNIKSSEDWRILKLNKKDYPLVYVQSAISEGNFDIASRRLKDITNYEKKSNLRNLEIILNMLIDYQYSQKQFSKSDIDCIINYHKTYNSQKIINTYSLLESIGRMHMNLINGELNPYLLRFLQERRISININYPIFISIKNHLADLYNHKEYDKIKELLYVFVMEGWGKNEDNPFRELILVYKLKTGIRSSIKSFDYLACVEYLRLVEKGLKTSLSDFIEESDDYKSFIQYLQYLQNQLKDYEYDENTKTLTINRDIHLEGNFCLERLYLYFPELKEKEIRNICINGNFIITGCLTSSDEYFYDTKFIELFNIKGDLIANEIKFERLSSIIEGNVIVEKYIYLDDYELDEEEGSVFRVNKCINTPLLILNCIEFFRHQGGFSTNCIIIGSRSCAKYLKEKVTYFTDLDSDLVESDKYERLRDVDEFIKKYKQGENIFKEGYDPKASRESKAFQELKSIFDLLPGNNIEEIEKGLSKALSFRITDEEEIVDLEIEFYRTYILYKKDREKNIKAIERGCKKILKLVPKLTQQPKWMMLLFAANNLADIYESNGDYKKALNLITQYNKGDEAHYVRKVNLLSKLGKEKELLFPAYIAIEHYKTKELTYIADSDGYKEYVKSIPKEFSIPKGYRKTIPSSLTKIKTRAEFDFDEDFPPIVYKGDVFWNGNFDFGEAATEYPEFDDFYLYSAVIFGDLYIKGDLTSWQGYLYVTGNIFVEQFDIVDCTLECGGNLIASKEVVIIKDIIEMTAYIYGNVLTTFLLSDSDTSLNIYGEIDPEAICIGIKGYNFDEYKINKLYSEKDINSSILTEWQTHMELCKHLEEGTLFKEKND